ncbi:hypothetical protein EJB05_53313, partial [Eragrostis curvula]
MRSGAPAARRDGDDVDRKPAINKPAGLHLALNAPDVVGRSTVVVRTVRPTAAAPAPPRQDEQKLVARKPVIKHGVRLGLKVQDTKGRTVKCTVRKTEKLQGLMDAYYASVPDVAYGTGRFLYDGTRVARWQTPAELEMDDGDEIDFFTELMGGGLDVLAAPVPV